MQWNLEKLESWEKNYRFNTSTTYIQGKTPFFSTLVFILGVKHVLCFPCFRFFFVVKYSITTNYFSISILKSLLFDDAFRCVFKKIVNFQVFFRVERAIDKEQRPSFFCVWKWQLISDYRSIVHYTHVLKHNYRSYFGI